MSGIAFYGIKALSIITVCILYFVVLSVFGFGMSLLFPDSPTESIEMSALYVLLYIGLAAVAFWVARTQLKAIPEMFHGVAGFDA
jgi:hypothetical protein